MPSNPRLLIIMFGFILIGLSLVSMVSISAIKLPELEYIYLSESKQVINLLQSKMRTTYEAGKDVVEVVEKTKDATTLGVLQVLTCFFLQRYEPFLANYLIFKVSAKERLKQVYEDKEKHFIVFPDEAPPRALSRSTQTSLSLPSTRHVRLNFIF